MHRVALPFPAPIRYLDAGRGFGLVAGADFKSVGGPARQGRGGFDSHPFRHITPSNPLL